MTSLPVPLSPGYIPTVRIGDSVKAGDTLAERKEQHEVSIDIPKTFGIPIKHTARTLRKNPGDRVRKGEVVASRTKTFGMVEDVIVSEIDGTVHRYERDRGQLIILPDAQFERTESKGGQAIFSPIDGVVELCDNDLSNGRGGTIILQTDKDIIPGVAGAGGEMTGEIHTIQESHYDPEGKVQLHFLDSRVIGKIVLGGTFARDSLVKAIGMGAAGVIGYEIRDEDLSHIAARHVRAPVVTVGKNDYLRLLQWHGKSVFVQGEAKTILLLHI